MKLPIVLAAVAALACGCSTPRSEPPPGDPASPQSPETPWSPPPDPLAGPVEPAEGASSEPKATEYVCPMHPDVRSDKPGECPKCGMALEPAKAGAGHKEHEPK